MKDFHSALEIVQNKLKAGEKITITKEGWSIEQPDNESTKDDKRVIPSSLDGVDVEMLRQMYD
jgi:hypothetical protein